jgi:hypothetical protein
MDALIDVLRNDRADTEITTSALEALINVTKSKKEGDNSNTSNDDDVGVMFTEIFVKNVVSCVEPLSSSCSRHTRRCRRTC